MATLILYVMDNQLQNDINSINQSSGIITQAAGVISSVGEYEHQRDWQKEMYKMALADQRKDIETARDYAETMYNKYESIPAQMRQMMEAGVNPNDAAQFVKGSQPSYQPAQSAPAVPQPAGVGLVPQSMANLAQVQLAASKQQAEIDQMKAETRGKEIENEYASREHELTINQAETLIDKNRAEINKVISDANLNDASTYQIYKVLPYSLTLTQTQIDSLNEQIAQARETVSNLVAERGEIYQRIRTLRSTENLNNASQELVNNQAETELRKAELTENENRLKEIEYQLNNERKKYEVDMLKRGIDPAKISYDFTIGSDNFGHISGNWSTLHELLDNLKGKWSK